MLDKMLQLVTDSQYSTRVVREADFNQAAEPENEHASDRLAEPDGGPAPDFDLFAPLIDLAQVHEREHAIGMHRNRWIDDEPRWRNSVAGGFVRLRARLQHFARQLLLALH